MLKRFGDNQEAFASSSELAPTRLGMTIEEQWPAFKLVGFGFYYAWIWVVVQQQCARLPLGRL